MKLFRYLLTLALLGLLLLAALPFSAVGSRWLLRGADSLAFLEIDYRQGSLLGELQLNHLQVNLARVVVALDDIALRLQRDCLWRSEFCFHYLRVGQLRVAVSDAAAADDEPKEGDQLEEGEDVLLQMPYPLRSDDVQIKQARVSWPGGAWQQEGLRGRVSFSGSRLRVPQAEIDSAKLLIDAGGEESASGFEPVRIFLPLEIELGQLRLGRAGMALAGWESTLREITLAGKWHGTRLSIAELRAASFGSAEMTVSGMAGEGFLDFAGQWPLQWTLAANTADEGLPPALRERELGIRVEGDFSALTLALESAGEPALAASGSLNILAAGLPFSVQGAARWPEGSTLGALSAAVPAQLAELQLVSPLAFSASGNRQGQTVQLAAAASGLGYEALQLQGQATLDGSVLQIDHLELSDVASASEVQFSGSATLGPAWTLRGQFNTPGLQVPEVFLPGAGRILGSASVQVAGEGGDWQLELPRINLRGQVKGMPASVQGYAGISSAMQLLPADLRAQLNGALLGLRLDGKGGAADELRVTVDDLGRWLPEGRGNLVLWGRGDFIQGDVELGGQALGVQADTLRVPAATLAGQWRRGGSLRLALNAPALEYAGRQLENLSLEVQGTEARHRIELAVEGELSSTLSVTGSFAEQGWRGLLAPLQLNTPSGPWLLAEPVTLQWQRTASALEVAPHCWRHPEFELCARRARVGMAGDIDLSLSGDISAFNGFLPPDLRMQGKLDTSWVASWGEQRSLQLAAQGRATDIRITRLFGLGETATLAWDLAEVNIRRGEDQLMLLDGTIERDGRRALAVTATLPPQRDGEVRGDVQLNALQLSALAPWAPLFSDLGGAVSGELALAGQLRSPTLHGGLALTDGRVRVEGNPTALTKLNLDVRLAGRGGRVSGSGLLGGGPVRLEGDFGWRPDAVFGLSIEGEKQRILLPPSSEALIGEQLRLSYAHNTLDIGGEIRVEGGLLRQEELPEGSVALSPDVVEVDTAGNVIRESQPFQLRTDLWLYIDDQFEVRGDNIQAVLGGTLHLQQEPTRPPQLFGALNIAGGELNAYRQRLEIRRGTVDFSGPVQNPGLDVTAERRIRADNVTVGARLFGTLESPQLEIYSDPPMSQGEAMSYLVRGRGLDAGADADGTALALSVGADVVNQSGIVRGLNRLPLINNVSFGSSGDEDETAATVGGYLGDRIYLSYGIGLYEPINEFTARLYLQSRLWLEVVSRLENSVDLYYSFDID